MKLVGIFVIGFAAFSLLPAGPTHALEPKNNAALKDGKAGETKSARKAARKAVTTTGQVGQPATAAQPLSVTECEGLGGKVMEAVRTCGTGVACATVSSNGVVKAICISSIN